MLLEMSYIVYLYWNRVYEPVDIRDVDQGVASGDVLQLGEPVHI